MLAARALGVKQRADRASGTCCRTRSSPVIVQATLVLATSILDAAALSFLGLGDPDADRAGVGPDARPRRSATSTRTRSWRSTRRVAIIIVALGFTLLGESLREAIDPKNRR